MVKFIFRSFILAFLPMFSLLLYPQQVKVIDSFADTSPWKPFFSEQVDIKTSSVNTSEGKCLKMDYNFLSGSGYGGITRKVRLELPKNYEFSFWLKAESPDNNLEFKLVDSAGTTVWWFNNRNYSFPKKWTRIVIKQRQINRAWGPDPREKPLLAASVEFVISSVNGGRGTLWLRQFELTERPEVSQKNLPMLAAASSQLDNQTTADKLVDGLSSTAWQSSAGNRNVNVIIDFQGTKECGGLMIDWDTSAFAKGYALFSSDDKKKWDRVYKVTSGKGGRTILPFRDVECRYMKLEIQKPNDPRGYRISEISPLPSGFGENTNNIYETYAAAAPRGMFPKYFLKEASYFNVCGADRDTKEALVNEEGQVESDKLNFSFEPFLYVNGRLITWNDVTTSQGLAENYLPVPVIKWMSEKYLLTITVFTDGTPDNCRLNIKYTVENKSTEPLRGKFFVALRPFQVNPTYQFLNTPGGTVKVKSISCEDGIITVNNEKTVLPLTTPFKFGVTPFDRGDISEFLAKGKLPSELHASDPNSLVSGAVEYQLNIAPSKSADYAFVIPFHNKIKSAASILNNESPEKYVSRKLSEVTTEWKSRLNYTKFNLPASADKYINTLRSNLAYILINKDKDGTQPGSRSYERSWIRDGSLTCSALLKFGMTDEVKAFIKWYASYQYPSGKIPCVVDRRGPDPVPENDSHGEFIFLVYEYFKFTKDTAFLNSLFPAVKRTVAYMDTLIATQSTQQYKTDMELKNYYGLMPASISHEGYSDKPMHSYWDDFFTMKGFKDAVEIASVLGKQEEMKDFRVSRDNFRTNFYNSIKNSTQRHKIDYLPGCADMGDFDATSTAIALFPCGEKKYLPKNLLENTFEHYYSFFQTRRDSADYNWVNYTPYEIRTTGSFLYLGQPEKSHAMLDYFFNDQRPSGWNHWAEVVWKDKKAPKFIGDMPHTWVGSEYVNALRAMFVYEDEDDNKLVIGAGVKQEWFDEDRGLSIQNLRTYYGSLNYSASKSGAEYSVHVDGSISIPRNGKIMFALPMLKSMKNPDITVNGKKQSLTSDHQLELPVLPAEIRISSIR